MRPEIMNNDSFWVAQPEITRLEIEWDRARIDAIEAFCKELRQRPSEEINTAEIAYFTAAMAVDFDSLSHYEDETGEYIPPLRIIEFNKAHLDHLVQQGAK